MKHALITFGNEESYGLSFVGGELLEHGQEIKFFEGEDNWKRIVDWGPDFLMFSPLTTFFRQSSDLAKRLKRTLPKAVTVFGGHHALADDEILRNHYVDITVRGPVRGSIERILNDERGIIKTIPTIPSDLPKPARAKYYEDIPRVGRRYRKFALSMLGCPWNCSYCSSSSGKLREMFGPKAHKDYWLSHRPLEDVIDEVKEVARYGTHEIEWVDDDIFAGDEGWLLKFISEWEKNFTGWYIDPYTPDRRFTLPMYISTTSHMALKISDEVLVALQPHVSAVGMGVQAIRPESLKLFNRSWDNEKKMKAAYDRLTSFGYRVNLQCIVGLPVNDPVEDAIETVMAMTRIGPGSICSCYPLQIYPGTEMERYCKEHQRPVNEKCDGDTNSAICGIRFSEDVEKKLRNICKLATFFVKYGVDERWVRAFIDIDFDEDTSKRLSMLRYRECVVDRLGVRGERIFDEILGSMRLRF